MQCVNCHFENIQGLDHCGRCGASLRIATAVIDVHPPRARDRRYSRLRLNCSGTDSVRATSAAISAGFDSPPLDCPPAFVIARLIIPGWPQLYLGQKIRGWFFLMSYFGFLIAGVLLLGTGFGSTLLRPAPIAVHASSVIDLVFVATGTEQAQDSLLLLLRRHGCNRRLFADDLSFLPLCRTRTDHASNWFSGAG